jgi:hypothetical protein
MDASLLIALLIMLIMLVCWLLSNRSHWFMLASAGACVLAAAYFFLFGPWPFGAAQLLLALVGLWQWRKRLNDHPASQTAP